MTNITIKKHNKQYLITVKRDEGNIETLQVDKEELVVMIELLVDILWKEEHE